MPRKNKMRLKTRDGQNSVYQGDDGEWRYDDGRLIDTNTHLHTLAVLEMAP